ncbi:MAG: peptidoglycan DD-metalloendopeptidase family protein [Bacteroidia bacterium]|nr:peptidoglycan DD-metalloendopeptidase family protein [Bacteroidia bacterium]
MNALFIKKNKFAYAFAILLALMFCLCPVIRLQAQKQSKSALEEKKKKLQQDIEYTNQLLIETKKSKKLSLNQLLTLNKKLADRQELIATINGQIYILNRQIAETNKNILNLQTDLKKLKDDYARMIYSAYRNRDEYSRLMFVFASVNFNQAYIRLKYLQQYNEYRRHQAELIELKQKELNDKLQELEMRKTEKRELLGTQEFEKETLTKEKSEKEVILNDLQSKEKQLKGTLVKKKKDAEKLQQAIMKIIREEIEKANADKSKPATRLVLTPEAQQLSSSFSKNRGKLPWPVIQGVIIDRFGSHPHPTMPDITINNNGVDIATSKGALARAVFDGEVTGVVNIPQSGKVIIIRHGEYLSVYANLNEVYVKAGDKITTKQNIGSILLDEEDSKTELHIEIWKGQTKLDPEDWLFR